MRTNGNGKDHSDARLSGYVTRQEKREWMKMTKRASEIDDCKPDNGTFLSRIIKNGLRLDRASISKYVKTHKRTREPDSVET